ncbi:hypothetical protein TNCV_946861 [Trichonephila clavipes]|nr:hypothetical protein TNCV_946861 [Trichonephila clavipes]
MTHGSVQEDAVDGFDDEEFFSPVCSTCTQRALAMDGQWAAPVAGQAIIFLFCLQPFAHQGRAISCSICPLRHTIWCWFGFFSVLFFTAAVVGQKNICLRKGEAAVNG